MAAGIPVIGTKTGGIPELLESDAGILVPQRDTSTIAEALNRLAAEFRHRLVQAGIEKYATRSRIESSVSALLKLP
jgi:glycosyltransferase involved in cell wall biosynthesis